MLTPPEIFPPPASILNKHPFPLHHSATYSRLTLDDTLTLTSRRLNITVGIVFRTIVEALTTINDTLTDDFLLDIMAATASISLGDGAPSYTTLAGAGLLLDTDNLDTGAAGRSVGLWGRDRSRRRRVLDDSSRTTFSGRRGIGQSRRGRVSTDESLGNSGAFALAARLGIDNVPRCATDAAGRDSQVVIVGRARCISQHGRTGTRTESVCKGKQRTAYREINTLICTEYGMGETAGLMANWSLQLRGRE